MTPSSNTDSRRRKKAAVITLALIAAGIGWRMLPLGLPRWAHKYGGSFLWGAMVYWVVAALLPRVRPRYVLLLAAAAGALTEFSRLYHTPGLDAFRATLAGRLLLGQYFALQNILVYWAGMAIAAAIDRFHFWPDVLMVPPPRAPSKPPGPSVV